MVRYARHCVCYVESFQMSGTIMGLACVRMVMELACVRMVQTYIHTDRLTGTYLRGRVHGSRAHEAFYISSISPPGNDK